MRSSMFRIRPLGCGWMTFTVKQIKVDWNARCGSCAKGGLVSIPGQVKRILSGWTIYRTTSMISLPNGSITFKNGLDRIRPDSLETMQAPRTFVELLKSSPLNWCGTCNYARRRATTVTYTASVQSFTKASIIVRLTTNVPNPVSSLRSTHGHQSPAACRTSAFLLVPLQLHIHAPHWSAGHSGKHM